MVRDRIKARKQAKQEKYVRTNTPNPLSSPHLKSHHVYLLNVFNMTKISEVSSCYDLPAVGITNIKEIG
jgi:hypothetical protein